MSRESYVIETRNNVKVATLIREGKISKGLTYYYSKRRGWNRIPSLPLTRGSILSPVTMPNFDIITKNNTKEKELNTKLTTVSTKVTVLIPPLSKPYLKKLSLVITNLAE